MTKKTIYTVLILMAPLPTLGMHIMEGYLPIEWSIFWSLLFVPIMMMGLRSIKQLIAQTPEKRMVLAMVVAFAFVLSSLKLPSVTGSSSHATGMAFGTALVGTSSMSIVGTVVLLFQVFLLAHGGITTLGANAFAMVFIGPIVTYLIFRMMKKSGTSVRIGLFTSALLGNLATYVFTALQLALAHPDAASGVEGAFLKFMGIFGITQVPVAIVEGLLTVVVINVLINNDFLKEEELFSIKGFGRKKVKELVHGTK